VKAFGSDNLGDLIYSDEWHRRRVGFVFNLFSVRVFFSLRYYTIRDCGASGAWPREMPAADHLIMTW